MRELDAVLQRFLEIEAPHLTDREIGCFEAILELPDPELHAYLLGDNAPNDAATAALVARIRTRPQA
jgi:succinate dehydrogenase flavin-adding protein (antitoxin of CptAB toxin-antitoxin module)